MDKNVLFTGHSLGGGLAACAASWSEHLYSITFNAAGVYDKTITESKFVYGRPDSRPRHASDPTSRMSDAFSSVFGFGIYFTTVDKKIGYKGYYSDKIYNYYTALDILSNAQKQYSELIPEAMGHQIPLNNGLETQEECDNLSTSKLREAESSDQKKLRETLCEFKPLVATVVAILRKSPLPLWMELVIILMIILNIAWNILRMRLLLPLVLYFTSPEIDQMHKRHKDILEKAKTAHGWLAVKNAIEEYKKQLEEQKDPTDSENSAESTEPADN